MTPPPAGAGESRHLDPLDVLRILQSAGGALFVQMLLHGQLAAIEWEQEKGRLLKMLLILLLGFACLICAMLFTGALVLATAWETAYRIPAIGGLVVVAALGVAATWRRFRVLSATGGKVFAASLKEFAADAALLKAVS